MKKIFNATLLFAVLSFSSFASVAAEVPPADREVQVGISGVYVPSGFNSSSDAYVIVNGVFQNGCYRWKKADVDHKETFLHEVKVYADVSPGMCIMALIPYQKEVRLGKLATGNHTLRFENGDGTYLEKTLVIQ